MRKLEEGAKPAQMNNFQAGYAIRHPWTGPIKCASPRRGVWGGPPGSPWSRPQITPSPNLGLVKASNVQLSALIKGTLPAETFLSAAGPTPVLAVPQPPPASDALDAAAPSVDASPMPPPEPPKGGCAGCNSSGSSAPSVAGLAALALLVRGARRWLRRRAGPSP